MRILTLVTDAFGTRGGIGQFNRDMLSAICAEPMVDSVAVLARNVTEHYENVPEKIAFDELASRSKVRFAMRLARSLMLDGSIDLVICGHINLLPLAWVAARFKRVPLLLIIHGIDAWDPPKRAICRLLASRVCMCSSVSQFTLERFRKWSKLDERRCRVIPNCIDLTRFRCGEKPLRLVQRYQLDGCKTILTVARLCSRERYKGLDEMLEAFPDVLQRIPEAKYLVVGDGDDRQRLQQKAASLGIADHVVFAGYIPEDEKVDHYRLADVFAMPGYGEGFGIVYLEAMACGVPVIASKRDASCEVVLDSQLGVAVAPDNQQEIVEAIERMLTNYHKDVNGDKIARFSYEQFGRRWHVLLDSIKSADTLTSC